MGSVNVIARPGNMSTFTLTKSRPSALQAGMSKWTCIHDRSGYHPNQVIGIHIILNQCNDFSMSFMVDMLIFPFHGEVVHMRENTEDT